MLVMFLRGRISDRQCWCFIAECLRRSLNRPWERPAETLQPDDSQYSHGRVCHLETTRYRFQSEPAMSKPFDATSKAYAEAFPKDWLDWLGWPSVPVEVVDADVSTVSGAADKVFRVGGEPSWLLMMEHLSSYKAIIPQRLHWHATLISYRHQLRVRSVVILLRREADGPEMTGLYEEAFPGETPHLRFRYRVVRLWEIPAGVFLKSGLGLLPLAPLGDVSSAELSGVVHQVRQRVEKECTKEEAADLLTATYVLMGLRYNQALIETIKREVSTMEESITYQEIKGKGRLEDAIEILGLVGADKFGPPDEAIVRAIRSIPDVKRLHRLILRVNHAASWQEVLQTN